MKAMVVLSAILLASCGGMESECLDCDDDYWQFEAQFCEAQGGTPEILHITNVSSGESYIGVECVFAKDSESPRCKPDNGIGECPR